MMVAENSVMEESRSVSFPFLHGSEQICSVSISSCVLGEDKALHKKIEKPSNLPLSLSLVVFVFNITKHILILFIYL